MKILLLSLLIMNLKLNAEESIFQKETLKNLNSFKLLVSSICYFENLANFNAGKDIIKSECKEAKNCLIDTKRYYKKLSLYDSYKGKKIDDINLYLSMKEEEGNVQWIGNGENVLYVFHEPFYEEGDLPSLELAAKRKVERGVIIIWDERKDGDDYWYRLPSINTDKELWYKQTKTKDRCEIVTFDMMGKVSKEDASRRILKIDFNKPQSFFSTLDNKKITKDFLNEYSYEFGFDEYGGPVYADKVQDGILFFKIITDIDKKGPCNVHNRKDAEEMLNKGTVFKTDLKNVTTKGGLLNSSKGMIGTSEYCPLDVNHPIKKIKHIDHGE